MTRSGAIKVARPGSATLRVGTSRAPGEPMDQELGKASKSAGAVASRTYDETRDREQLRVLGSAIKEYIDRRMMHGRERQTIFFFPAGTASHLARADSTFDESLAQWQEFTYTRVWLTLDTFVSDVALRLAMHKVPEGDHDSYRDLDNHIVVADGTVGIFGVEPHTYFLDWCERHDLDYFVFPWDWRRPLEDITAFFVNQFLPHFQKLVMDAKCPSPLAMFSLVGHSFGGMIANLVLRTESPITAGMRRAITVATPFYGYGSQMHRWFEGEPLLNHLGTDRIIKLISSFPSFYTLSFLDLKTFNANFNALSTDEYPISSYPSVDEKTRKPADPFNPETQGNQVRYPTSLGFDPGELDHGNRIARRLIAPLNKALSEKFYNIRAVQLGIGTASGITWDWIPPRRPPFSSPIANDMYARGDDTQPAWTARLLDTKAPFHRKQCISVEGRGDSFHHIFLMNNQAIHNAMGNALGLGLRAQRIHKGRKMPIATSEKAIAAVQARYETHANMPGASTKQRARKAAAAPWESAFSPEVALRILMDILKRSPTTVGTYDKPAARATAKTRRSLAKSTPDASVATTESGNGKARKHLPRTRSSVK